MRVLSLTTSYLLGKQFLTLLSNAAEGLQQITVQGIPIDNNKHARGLLWQPHGHQAGYCQGHRGLEGNVLELSRT